MSSDRFFRRSGSVSALLSGLAVLALLAGCQVRPLYSDASGTAEQMASVGFSEPETRIEQVVRNHLIFLTSGGAGEIANPAYDVTLRASTTATSVIDDEDDDNVSPSGLPQPGRVRVIVNYTLTRVSDGKVLKSASREVVSLMDVSRQGFAKLRALRDAENRAAREAAEFIRAEIAIILARQPQPQTVQQTVWQK